MLQVKSRNLPSLSFGLASLQQKTGSRSHGKVGSAFEYLQSCGMWGNDPENVMPSKLGRGVSISDWLFTVHLLAILYNIVGRILPLRVRFRHDSSGMFSGTRGSDWGHTRLIECMNGGQ